MERAAGAYRAPGNELPELQYQGDAGPRGRRVRPEGETVMLSQRDSELFRDRTCQLLADVGMKIESEAVVEAMLARGCRQAASGRNKKGSGVVVWNRNRVTARF
jgi:hypothetical protein